MVTNQVGGDCLQVPVASIYCVMTGGGDTDFRVEEPTLLLSSCPIVSLWAWEGGVAMQPHPHPPGLLLLWLPSQPLQVIHPCQPTATAHLYSLAPLPYPPPLPATHLEYLSFSDHSPCHPLPLSLPAVGSPLD